MTAEFDCIVVGAGSAGCAVAARLAEGAAVRVLLIGSPPSTETRKQVAKSSAKTGTTRPDSGEAPFGDATSRLRQTGCVAGRERNPGRIMSVRERPDGWS